MEADDIPRALYALQRAGKSRIRRQTNRQRGFIL
jgi:hypothetical protein